MESHENALEVRHLRKAFGVIKAVDEIDFELLRDKKNIGISAGASAPEYIVQDLIKFLKNLNFSSVRNIAGSEEDITFKLPRELID